MGCFLDLSDDCFAVTLEGAGHDHEAGEVQVALQKVAAHLPDLCGSERSSSLSVTTWCIFTPLALWKLKHQPADD